MKWVLMAIFLVLLEFSTHQQIMNLNNQELAYQRVSYAMNLATQDAVQDVTPSSVANGQPIFDQVSVNQTLQQDIASNLNLDPTTLQPNPGSMFTVAPVIEEVDYIDWSNVTFPYHYTNPEYGIDMILTDPSVFFVVQFTIPSIANNVKPFTVTIPMVESYQGP